MGRSRTRTNDPVQSWVFVAASWCHALFVLGQTERTCPALLREVAPYGCLDQASLESYITSVLVFNLRLVLFVQVNENDVLLLYSDARKSFTRDFKNVFGTVPISCGFTFPHLLSSPLPPLPLKPSSDTDGLISCDWKDTWREVSEAGKPAPKR